MGYNERTAWMAQRGANALSYGLVLGLISIGAIASIEAVGGGVSGLFDDTRVSIDGGRPCAADTIEAGLSYGEISHRDNREVSSPLDPAGIANATAAETVYTVSCNDGTASISGPRTVVTACEALFVPDGDQCRAFSAIIGVLPTSVTAVITDGTSPGSPEIVTITNTGERDSGLVSFSLTAGAGQFEIAGAGTTCETGVTTLAPAQTCDIAIVRVATVNEASASGTLTIGFANAVSDQTVALSGAASGFAAGELSWTDGDGTAMDIAGPTPDSTSRCETFTLENIGDQTITGLGVSLSANPGGHFSLGCATSPADDCPASGGSLAGGATCTVSAEARASANATMTATVTATASDDGLGGVPANAEVSLTGAASGFNPGTLSWTAGDGSNMDVTGPFSSLSRCETFTLSNTGDLAVTGLGVALTNNSNGYFALGCGGSDTCPASGGTLAGGATCTASVQADVSTDAAMSATLRASGTDDGYGSIPAAADAALSGTASGFIGSLTPGNTTQVITRDGFSARCTSWDNNDPNRCNEPQVRLNPSALSGGSCPGDRGDWYDANYFNAPDQGPTCEAFCFIATGSTAHTFASFSGFSCSSPCYRIIVRPSSDGNCSIDFPHETRSVSVQNTDSGYGMMACTCSGW